MSNKKTLQEDSNFFRIEVGPKKNVLDPIGDSLRARIKEWTGCDPGVVKLIKVFFVKISFQKKTLEKVAKDVFFDPIVEQCLFNQSLSQTYGPNSDSLAIERCLLPGVTDNIARTTKEALLIALDIPNERSDGVEVFSAEQILILNGNEFILNPVLLNTLTNAHYNPLIEKCTVLKSEELKDGGLLLSSTKPSKVELLVPSSLYEEYALDVKKISEVSEEKHLGFSPEEIQVIVEYFSQKEVLQQRKEVGLPDLITDVEIECLAQTWSEHCKHKIFSAEIDYEDEVTGKRKKINGIFSEFIKSVTQQLESIYDGFLVSTFKDNSGIIRFDDKYDICFKVETHNSPSALDPFGGAITGIVGVNRDILGTGLGAKPIFNTDVFCFGSLDYEGEVPPGLMHPKRIAEGVIRGVEEGGNKSGIPTVNGSILFDPSYLGKPLVFCGTGGILPRAVKGLASSGKYTKPGDLIVMVGGRIGKDGIHGATFSSRELDETSPVSAVQIGDPITQKRMMDMLLIARDQGMISGTTDNGAGGLSSSVGEMALLTGGAELDLAAARLKYQGLSPWEILVSESQERMTVSVRTNCIESFKGLADECGVEISILGIFTSSGVFHLKYAKKTVGYLPLEFLHEGCPQLKLKAVWNEEEQSRVEAQIRLQRRNLSVEKPTLDQILLELLSDENISSREGVIRKYDHEVQAQSIEKSLVGVCSDAPSDAAVIEPLCESKSRIVISNGINPWLSLLDPLYMAKACVDEAYRNAICVGGDPKTMAILDNFCWPDPLYDSEKTPDGKLKLAQLVRTCMGLKEAALSYSLPLISGKDSMKNDYIFPKNHVRSREKISVLPTLLISLFGVMDSKRIIVSSDFKIKGNRVGLIGPLPRGLSQSAYDRKGYCKDPSASEIDLSQNYKNYQFLSQIIQQGVVDSCHDISDGGLLVALSECCLGGRIGAEIELEFFDVSEEEFFFSETPGLILIEYSKENEKRLEGIFGKENFKALGTIGGEHLNVRVDRELKVSLSIEEIKSAYVDGGVFKWR